jgi:hypothetical protein
VEVDLAAVSDHTEEEVEIEDMVVAVEIEVASDDEEDLPVVMEELLKETTPPNLVEKEEHLKEMETVVHQDVEDSVEEVVL